MTRMAGCRSSAACRRHGRIALADGSSLSFGSTVNYGFVRVGLKQATGASGALAPIKLLNVEPVKGYAGETFTVHGDGLPAGKKVEFLWSTVEPIFDQGHDRQHRVPRAQI